MGKPRLVTGKTVENMFTERVFSSEQEMQSYVHENLEQILTELYGKKVSVKRKELEFQASKVWGQREKGVPNKRIDIYCETSNPFISSSLTMNTPYHG